MTDSQATLIANMLSPETSRDTFFLLYSRLLELRFGATNLEFEAPDRLSLNTANGLRYVLFLENLWIECRTDLDEGEAVVNRYLEVFGGFDGDPKPRREVLVPLVKDQTYVDLLGKSPSIPLEHLVGDLWVVYAADGANSIATITFDDLLAMDIAQADLRDLATENLRRLLPEVECHGDGPWFLLTAGADFVASLLLLDSVWDYAMDRVEGDIIAVAPSRDVVLFTGSGSAEGLKSIRDRAKEIVATSSHVVSATLLRRIPEGWRVFD